MNPRWLFLLPPTSLADWGRLGFRSHGWMPPAPSTQDRLYVIDCGDGSGTDESHWTPTVNVGTRVGFPGHCYLIHHAQGGSCGTRVLTTL